MPSNNDNNNSRSSASSERSPTANLTEESLLDEIKDGTAPQSTESNIRYAAYATRLKTALSSAQRYVAYTSDIGESFRPVAHPILVRAAYGISWAYILGDVSFEGYKAYCNNQRQINSKFQHQIADQTHKNDVKSKIDSVPDDLTHDAVTTRITPLEDYRTVMAQRAIFQSIASMGLPAFTIHSIVRYSGRALKDIKNIRLRTYGPIGLGLAAVPALPLIFDEPVENAVEFAFHWGFKTFGWEKAVENSSKIGRGKSL